MIAICRRVYGDDLLRLSEALCAGGVALLEVTFDQTDPACIEKTCRSITALCARFGEGMHFGAGTALGVEQVNAACEAGARYIISPNADPSVIAQTKRLGLVSMPGAMTPTEIQAAHLMGADIVKLFPAGELGFKYIKDILAPLSHIKLCANGGVTEENLKQYLSSGCVAAGVSGRLCDRALIADGNFAELTRRAARFAEIAEE